MNLNGNSRFYRSFFSVYIALVLQNVVTLSVNLADNIMLGSYSEAALSGAAAVNQIQFVFQQLIMALGDGLVILGSQYWGKRQTEPMKKLGAQAMQAALAVTACLFVLVSMMPHGILKLFTTDEPIIREGMKYLGIIRFTYLFFAMTQILLAVLRSVEMVKVAFYLSVVTFCINCGINFILIYGRFGAPELGAEGAAIGTLTARIAEFIILLVYIFKKEKSLHLRPGSFLKTDRTLSMDYLKITAPMFAVNGLWGLNTALQTVVLGHMTSAAIAANSMASTIFLMVKSMAVGAASAASIMIGKSIGEGSLEMVKQYAKKMQLIFVMIGLISGMILFFIRIPILELYELTPETKEMANTFLLILSVIIVGMSYQMPTNNGIIRGGGSPVFVVKMDLISIWCIVIPVSFFMAFIWCIVIPVSFFMAFVVQAPPAAVVCCLNADQLFKCIPAYIKANHGSWIRELTR